MTPWFMTQVNSSVFFVFLTEMEKTGKEQVEKENINQQFCFGHLKMSIGISKQKCQVGVQIKQNWKQGLC